MIMKDIGDKSDKNGSSFIRLSLRKPREWKVALTTSVSSPAIIPPDIQLWDEERGDILLDTSDNCPRSKSASFRRRSPSRDREKYKPNSKKSEANLLLKHSNSDKPLTPLCRSQRQEDVRKNRSRSLSGRIVRQEELIKPGDYARPPTPVMMARRVSLPKGNSRQTCSEKSKSVTPTQPNGITTHHRKQLSDSSGTSGKRKVKHNVSFGRVDTIDDSSSISSSFSLNKSKRHMGHNNIQSDRCSSSPRIVITEVADSTEDGSKSYKHSDRNQAKQVKHRSRSGIPVRMPGQRDSSTGGSIENGRSVKKRSTNQNTQKREEENVGSSRRSRMDFHMHEGARNHRFDVVHIPDLPEPPPLLPPPDYREQPIRHHRSCERGNCPLAKYYVNLPAPVQTIPTRKVPAERNTMYNKTKVVTSVIEKGLSYEKRHTKKERQVANQTLEQKKQTVVKPRKKRAPSKSREEMMSSSSSESEDLQSSRIPPRRRRRSRIPKGDRLVGVNGQCVRSPLEAEELLRTSADVVHLHLQRHGVSQSLPRHRVEEVDTMGSNMSRHSGKGLTGRRSQSSGNLCNGKAGTPGVARFFSPCGRGTGESVGPRDRYKFCGSLPNHLDAKDPALDDVMEADDDSSYKNNNNVRHLNKSDVTLRLQPLVPRDSVAQDQGYGSERSPEDEVPPDLPPPSSAAHLTCPVHHPASKPVYPFLHKNSTFMVTLVKGTRGLGLSVTGGVDTEEPWPGLIRIKRLFPHQPAWQSGQLAQGDFLLVVNNTSLVGLTNYEALEVLRTTPTEVVLTVCRPPPELQVLSAPPPAESAPIPPRRDPVSTSSLQLPLKRMESFGEFELTLKKVNGSLGFTLRKEDESVLGHYVRALVREPALSDGRIKPGDKIVAVNGVDMSPMSHEEAVMYLRQCGQEVHLKLYRDPAQTPVQALSPTEHHRTFKPILRKEAQDMLSDLAVKKSMSPNESSGSSTLSNAGRTSSPRKRRLTKTPSPDLHTETPENHLSWSNEVLERVTPGVGNEKPRRPDSLNFSAERKPHFQFSNSGHNKTEDTLNSSDSLDCCTSLAGMDPELGVGPLPSEPVSMPPLLSSTSDSTIGFSYRNPAYRSANPAPSKSKSTLSEDLPENRCSDNDLSGGMNSENSIEGSKGLLKWKGVVFTPEDGAESATSPDDSISQITEVGNSSNQVLVVELNRGWNSRLGFSLQQSGRNTQISAIHPDSVASRDGRLKAEDQLIMVNDESIEGMSTTEVINLLRKIRGSICITVWRKNS